jgi:hypothetical protein
MFLLAIGILFRGTLASRERENSTHSTPTHVHRGPPRKRGRNRPNFRANLLLSDDEVFSLSNTLCNVAASSSRGLNKQSLLSNRTLKLILQAPEKFRNEISKGSQYPIVWDSGASISITPYKQDFNGTLQMLNCGIKLQGVSEGLQIGGKGTVTWTVMDSAGMLR